MSSVSGISSTQQTQNNTVNTTGKTTSGTDFSAVLNETLEKQLIENSVSMTAGAGSASGASSGLTNNYSSFSGGGIESLILAAATTGEVSDAQLAMFMLAMMMDTTAASGNSDMSQLMSMMASMLGQINGDTQGLYNDVMNSEYSPYTLDQISKGVFDAAGVSFGSKSAAMPGTSGTSAAIVPVEFWKPTTPAVVSDETNRSPERLRQVIDQFDVENSERYEPYRDGYTYCNIFVWDVTSALGCEIPHYVNADTGEPMYYPDIKGATSLGAIATEKWLVQHGAEYGWREVTAQEAQAYANAGKAAVTTAGSIGHVQVVCPSNNGEFDTIRGVTVAQAGSKVYNYTNIASVYSANGMKSVRYFVHE